MQTLTYNCPNCHQGNLEIWEIDSVMFEHTDDHNGPVRVNLTGTAKCNNCDAEYWMDAKDVKYGAYQWENKE